MTKYSVYIILFFVIFGCGGGGIDNKVAPQTTVSLAEENKAIDIEKAKENIRTQLLGTEKAKFFVSPDKKDIFVLLNTYDFTALYDYDVTVDPPIQRNIISFYPEDHIIDVVILPDGKLLYQQETPVSLTIVHVYDYILTKDVCKYYIWSYSSLKLIMNEKLDQFTVGNIKVDLSFLYEKKPYIDQNIYQDYLLDVVIDEVNDLIWENGFSVLNGSYTLEDAKAYCRQKVPHNSWRVPTVDDINKLIIYQERILPYLDFYNGDDTTSRAYWLDDANENIDTAYRISMPNFSSNKKSIDIILSTKRASMLSQNLHIRCVMDLNERY